MKIPIIRVPIIPLLVATILLSCVFYLFSTLGESKIRILDAPQLSRIADIPGVETELAISPDGARCAVVVDGDLWMLNLTEGTQSRIAVTPEPESSPAWSPDGGRLTFTRGNDTFVLPTDAMTGRGVSFKTNATILSWSSTGRQTYIRDRGLWLTDVGGRNDKQIVAPDENPNVTLRAPRFSPDSLEIAFIKSLLNLSGQVWTVNALNGRPRGLVTDRPTENPLDVGWLAGGAELVYLTNRSGAYSVWHVNFDDNTLIPLTPPLMTLPVAPIGMSVWKDRILLPRHFIDSNITLSDGKTVVQSEDLEFEPAVSPDGKIVAYTVLKGNESSIWTAGINGSNPAMRTVGHEPRFTTDGFHLVYTQANLDGNDDIWRLDIRNGSTERVTDADEMDVTPDASPDGRWIAFTSTRGVAPSVWIISAAGGKRLRLNDGGYGPRFSANGESILFWNKGTFWIMRADGSDARSIELEPASTPAVGAWFKSTPLQVIGNEIRGPAGTSLFTSPRMLTPRFDVMPDGRFLIAPIDIRDTGVWAVDLVFRTQ